MKKLISCPAHTGWRSRTLSWRTLRSTVQLRYRADGWLGIAAVLALLLLPQQTLAGRVHFVTRVNNWQSSLNSNVYYYGSHINDGTAFVASFKHPRNGRFYANARGNKSSGDHAYSGSESLDLLLSDGLVFSRTTPTDWQNYFIWDPADGSLLYTNTVALDNTFAYMTFAPLPPLRGLPGGDIPRGSMVGLNAYNWGDCIAIFPRAEEGFAPRRFRKGLFGVSATIYTTEGLVSGTDYFGHVYANYHLAASLVNGTIACTYTGSTNLWLANPDNGANTNYNYSSDIDFIQSIIATPNGEIGLVGANRKLRFYSPTYSGSDVPELGPVVRSVDIPDDHGSWVTDACAFQDGTVGLLFRLVSKICG